MEVFYKNESPGITLREAGLTIVHPYYNEPKRLELQYETWLTYSVKTKKAINIVLADDGSNPPAIEWFTPSRLKRLGCKLTIHQIDEDLLWNTPGALNLGITQATTDWVMIMDSDCLLKADMLEKLLDATPAVGLTYWFNRQRVSSDKLKQGNTRFLPCTILFHKDIIEQAGPFDEDFTGARSGGYGFFDSEFSTRIRSFGVGYSIYKDIIVTEYLEDVVGPNIQQKTGVERDKHHKINKALWYAKKARKIPRNQDILNFKWHTVLEHMG